MEKRKILLVSLILITIIALVALYIENQKSTPEEFLKKLYNAPESVIIMDISKSPDQTTSTKIMQCAVNLISGEFYATTSKKLEVYGCDSEGCLYSMQNFANKEEQINQTQNATKISYEQMLSKIKNKPYIYIGYNKEQSFKAYSNYLEIFLNSSADPENCKIKISFQ
jgi:hypothetical protein